MIDIIAEVGVNHQNDLGTAHALIAEAAAAGATTVKFQASTVVEEVSFKGAPEHFADLGKIVPTWDFLKKCKSFCDEAGVEFLCTPAGPDSLKFVVEDLNVRRIKIASDNLTNVAFLRQVRRYDRPIILSTGMADMHEILEAVAAVASRTHQLTIMHCVSAYPTPIEQINLGAMNMLRRYGILGLSDHTDSKLVPALAVAAGADVIEKHITLDRDAAGPDHKASLIPAEFKVMVEYIKKAEIARGHGTKVAMPAEFANMKLYRKSLVAAKPIKVGEPFTIDNLTAKRPGTGKSASLYFSYLGLIASRSYEEDELI